MVEVRLPPGYFIDPFSVFGVSVRTEIAVFSFNFNKNYTLNCLYSLIKLNSTDHCSGGGRHHVSECFPIKT